jgi:hypothetical protein
MRIQRLVVIPEDCLQFDDYESGIGSAASRRAPAVVCVSDPAQGRASLDVAAMDRNLCSAYLREKPFDAVRYPYCSFDYRIGGANVSMMFKCEGHFKDIEFVPGNIPLNLYKDIYYSIAAGGGMTLGVFGKIPDVRTDRKWGSTTFRIMELLKGEPFNGRYIVEELALRECRVNEVGVWASIDNFCIWGPESRYLDVRVVPPAGFDEEKLSYEWRLLDADGREVVPATKSRECTWRVHPPKGSGYTLCVRVLHNNRPSSFEYRKPLDFFAVK